MDEFQGEFNSEGIISNDKFNLSKYQKYLIIGAVTGGFVLLLIIIIILIASSSGGKPSKKVIGKIYALYDIFDTTTETIILGDNFNNQENLGIIINNKKVKFSKKYKFQDKRHSNVTYEIYDSINLDNMFQDVQALLNITMISEKNAEISSMKSTFENCQNLVHIYIYGFNTLKVKSMTKLFSNTNIQFIQGLNTDNVEDFSYMFASIQSDILEFESMKTSKATNMSHMFDNSNINLFDFSNLNTSNVLDMSKDVNHYIH